MADVLLFHHVLGRTAGILHLAEVLEQAGHTLHTPDLFEGRIFETIEEGFAFVKEIGFETLMERVGRQRKMCSRLSSMPDTPSA